MNKTKHFLIAILVIIIASFLCYKYRGTLQYQSNNSVSTSTVSTTSTTIEYPVITKNSGIILNETGIYKNLGQEGKKIIDDEFKSYGTDISYLKEVHDSSFLKYYDERIAIIGEISIKPTLALGIFDRKNMKSLDDVGSKLYARPLNYFVGYAENKQYMISAYDDGIVYYKAGNYDIKLLPNSGLKAGETYSKTNEMVNEYDLSISTSTTAVLKAGVFSDTEYDGNYHKRLREVEYVLP